VLTVRTELTDRMLTFGERHLRRVLDEYARHYSGQRPHRARQLRPPRPDHPIPAVPAQRITRRTVLGGLLNEYSQPHRTAAQTGVAAFGTHWPTPISVLQGPYGVVVTSVTIRRD
jgi:hypothetical protein